MDWYLIYLNHPCGSRLAKTIRGVYYWKGLVIQAELYANPCKICQRFKNRNTIYVQLLHKNIVELKPWDLVHVDLIGSYSKSIKQQQPGSAIMKNNGNLACMTMIDPSTGWF